MLTRKQKKLVEEIPENCESIPGWIGRIESETLVQYASRKLEGVIVNVGTYKGKSAIIMALASSSLGTKIYTIDTEEHEGFRQNLRAYNVEDRVVSLIKKSFEVQWNEPIKLLFIDGSHDYADVKADFEHFEPYVVMDGIICFHDSDLDEEPGVKQFLELEILEFCPKCLQPINRCKDRFIVERRLGNMLCLRKITC